MESPSHSGQTRAVHARPDPNGTREICTETTPKRQTPDGKMGSLSALPRTAEAIADYAAAPATARTPKLPKFTHPRWEPGLRVLRRNGIGGVAPGGTDRPAETARPWFPAPSRPAHPPAGSEPP